jgi:hypothetical protein
VTQGIWLLCTHMLHTPCGCGNPIHLLQLTCCGCCNSPAATHLLQLTCCGCKVCHLIICQQPHSGPAGSGAAAGGSWGGGRLHLLCTRQPELLLPGEGLLKAAAAAGAAPVVLPQGWVLQHQARARQAPQATRPMTPQQSPRLQHGRQGEPGNSQGWCMHALCTNRIHCESHREAALVHADST